MRLYVATTRAPTKTLHRSKSFVLVRRLLNIIKLALLNCALRAKPSKHSLRITAQPTGPREHPKPKSNAYYRFRNVSSLSANRGSRPRYLSYREVWGAIWLTLLELRRIVVPALKWRSSSDWLEGCVLGRQRRPGSRPVFHRRHRRDGGHAVGACVDLVGYVRLHPG